MIFQKKMFLSTSGFSDIKDITPFLRDSLAESKFSDGHLIVFVPGATAGLTTIEYEPGLVMDFPELMEKLVPMNASYHHDNTWHDGNGYAHLRAALIGPSITIPFEDGKLVLGTWQQVIFIDFDNRPRQRQLHLQLNGEVSNKEKGKR
jgi:secondary thiamine-phosphate synthase enzyme